MYKYIHKLTNLSNKQQTLSSKTKAKNGSKVSRSTSGHSHPKPPHTSLSDLERALEDLTQQMAEKKHQLIYYFRQIHQMVAVREMALLAELDAIQVDVATKIEERRESLAQLTQHRSATEKDLMANKLNALLHKQLDNIKEEMDNILSEQIAFPHLSISCQVEEIEKTLKEKCRILNTPNPYVIRTLPVWHGVKKGGEEDELNNPSAVCIDPTTQLIYVGEYSDTQRIQVFTSEGEHHSTLRNQLLNFCRYINIHREHIYASTGSPQYHFLKLNKEGEVIETLTLDTPVRGLSIEGVDIYTCAYSSLSIQIYDLSLKPTKRVILKTTSFDGDSNPRDIIVRGQQILFRYWINSCHPDPIQVFRLYGTFIRTLVTGTHIRYAYYFCFDSYENILVSDCRGHCFRIFSPDGILLQSIGERG